MTSSPPERAPSTAQLIRMLPALRQRRAEAEAVASRALAEVDALQRIIDGVEGLAGEPPATPPLFLPELPSEEEQKGPRGQEAVRQVMLTNPDRIWPLAAITRGVMSRGWINPKAKTPQAAIRAATQRLAGSGQAEKVAVGRYRLTAAGMAQGGDDEA